MTKYNSIDQNEVNKFNDMAKEWWNPTGKLHTLHAINPIRLKFIKNKIEQHFGSWPNELKILDIGCGGGLASVPLAKLGAKVTGIDASINNVKAAMSHSKIQNLQIKYICETAENHKDQYDVVICLELVEHVNDVEKFIASVAKLIKPNGIVIFSTLNRTPKSFLLSIALAEYVLRWVPKGTHDYQKFIKPSELAKYAANNELKLIEMKGMEYNIITKGWSLNDNVNVNYLAYFSK